MDEVLKLFVGEDVHVHVTRECSASGTLGTGMYVPKYSAFEVAGYTVRHRVGDALFNLAFDISMVEKAVVNRSGKLIIILK